MSFHTRNELMTVCTASVCLLITTISTHADIIHVPGDYPSIKEAVIAALDGDEIIVADGIYTGPANRNIDYFDKPITVRSANGPDNCVIDCESSGRGFWFHSGETAMSILDGFTIKNGFVGNLGFGAGIFCDFSGPTIRNCILSSNVAGVSGGGMVISNSSNPVITNCTFDQNSAGTSDGGAIWCIGSVPTFIDCTFTGNIASDNGGAIYMADALPNPILTGCTFILNGAANGGGIYLDNSNAQIDDCLLMFNGVSGGGGGMVNFDGSNSTVSNSTFASNIALNADGGGAWNFNSSPTFINCIFTGNTSTGAAGDGGAMASTNSNVTVINSTFSENVTANNGGAMYLEGKTATATVTNCTIADNTADVGSGGAMAQFFGSHASVANCILWDDSPPEIVEVAGATTTVQYSDVENGWPGTGNIAIEPSFVDQLNGNYRLTSGSAGVDAADNTAVPNGIDTDLDGNPRFVDDPKTNDTGNGSPPIVDMGAYEFQPGDCPWDLDGNGSVGASDLLSLLANWGPCKGCPADFDDNGNVGASDLLALFVNWGPCP